MHEDCQVIFVDWNKTLSDSLFWEHLQTEDPETYNLAQSWLFKTCPQDMLQWMSGDKGVDDILSAMAQDIARDKNDLHRELVKSCQQMTFAFEGCLDVIATIRSKGIKVVLATDNMDVFDHYTVPSLKLRDHFDDILNSAVLKCVKGSEDAEGELAFFSSWLALEDIPLKNCVLIDDNVKAKAFFEEKGLRFLPVDERETVMDHLRKYAA